MTSNDKTNLIPVLIAVARKSVYFGYIDPATRTDRTLEVHGLRNCMYWSADTGGFFGLAATGPSAGCRIGAEVPGCTTTHDVVVVVDVSPAAEAAWKAAPCYRG